MKLFKKILIGAVALGLVFATPSAALAWDHPNKPAAQEAFQKLLGLGYTPQAAAGVLGNAETESGFNPGIVQAGDPTWINSVKDDPCNPGYTQPGGKAIGFFQWDAGRGLNMLCYMKENNKQWDTVDSALHYMTEGEVIKNGNPWSPGYSFDELKAMTDVRGAVDYFMRGWERCGQCHEQRRYDAAEGIYSDFKDLGPLELGDSPGKESKKIDVTKGGKMVVDEWGLTGMPDKIEWSGAQDIKEASRDDLSFAEQFAVSNLGEDLKLADIGWTDWANVGVSFVGLMTMMWGMFILFGMVFDKANVFINISLTKILTFGRLEYEPDPDMHSKETGKTGAGGFIKRSALAIVIGLVLVSGVMTGLVNDAILAIQQVESNLRSGK